ncbi:MAG: hypothetical protein FJ137_09965 [Deltaproteobacteria bacterium]|nr:hypothetical protein [Deltaproteobacteria bacterium]
MRTLDIDWADLEIAFRDAGTESYLDRDGGDVLSIVDGFDDERDLRERLARFPGRFVPIVPVDRAFTAAVVERFVARQKPAVAARLRDAFAGAGGLSRVMALLRDDKPLLQAFARFEQAELLQHIERFLAGHGLSSAEQAPGLELFEGTA